MGNCFSMKKARKEAQIQLDLGALKFHYKAEESDQEEKVPLLQSQEQTAEEDQDLNRDHLETNLGARSRKGRK